MKISDPCEEKNRLVLHVSSDRSTSCRDKSLRFCDSRLQQNWYKPMMGSAHVKMASSCVERDSCGTEAPIWLNGNTKLKFKFLTYKIIICFLNNNKFNVMILIMIYMNFYNFL